MPTWCHFIKFQVPSGRHVEDYTSHFVRFPGQRYDGSRVSRQWNVMQRNLWSAHWGNIIFPFQKATICIENLTSTSRQRTMNITFGPSPLACSHWTEGRRPGPPPATTSVPCPCGRVLADDTARRHWFFLMLKDENIRPQKVNRGQ